MVKFPQGYHLFSGHKFDNTINNPNTPDPNVAVTPGLFTTNEMLFDSYLFAYYQAGDENVDIAAILANDPLFYPTGTSQTASAIIEARAYPNPFNSETNIEYSLFSSQFVQISIFNNLGQEIKQLSSGIEATGLHRHSWDGRDTAGKKVSQGMYVYKIQAGKQYFSGKIMLE
jgi:hypothetical protein